MPREGVGLDPRGWSEAAGDGDDRLGLPPPPPCPAPPLPPPAPGWGGSGRETGLQALVCPTRWSNGGWCISKAPPSPSPRGSAKAPSAGVLHQLGCTPVARSPPRQWAQIHPPLPVHQPAAPCRPQLSPFHSSTRRCGAPRADLARRSPQACMPSGPTPLPPAPSSSCWPASSRMAGCSSTSLNHLQLGGTLSPRRCHIAGGAAVAAACNEALGRRPPFCGTNSCRITRSVHVCQLAFITTFPIGHQQPQHRMAGSGASSPYRHQLVVARTSSGETGEVETGSLDLEAG